MKAFAVFIRTLESIIIINLLVIYSILVLSFRNDNIQCRKIPAKYINNNNTSNSTYFIAMPNCNDIHQSNPKLLSRLKSKEDFIENQFKINKRFSSLNIIQLLYMKSLNSHTIKLNRSNNSLDTFYYVVIGDSMSKQSFYAFACQLEYYNAVEVDLLENETAKYYIQHHPYYHYLYGANSEYYLRDNFLNRHKEFKYILSWNQSLLPYNDNSSNHRYSRYNSMHDIVTKMTIHMIFIWKVGLGKDPGIIGNFKMSLQSKKPFEDLLNNFIGKQALILYNEGFHHPNYASLRIALQYLSSIFQKIGNQASGPYIFIRESNAVHFQSLNNTKPGYYGLYQSANKSIKHCIQTISKSSYNNKIWMNEVLYSRMINNRKKVIMKYIPLYAITTIWADELHFYPDCLHPGCYSIYYWMPLFDAIYRSFAGISMIAWDKLVSNSNRKEGMIAE